MIRIIIDTGFAGAQHIVETEYTKEGWEALSDIDQQDIIDCAIQDHITVHVENHDD